MGLPTLEGPPAVGRMAGLRPGLACAAPLGQSGRQPGMGCSLFRSAPRDVIESSHNLFEVVLAGGGR